MVQKFKEEARIISSQLANVEFSYSDPEKNFDRSRVKGVVAKLINVKDSSAVVALEVANAFSQNLIVPVVHFILLPLL